MKYTHVILTFTKSQILLNEEETERLRRVGLDDWFSHSGGKIKGSAIAEIITISEFYNRFPDKRPAEDLPEWHASREDYVPIEQQAEKNQSNMRGLLQGLKQFCDEHPEAQFARQMYADKLNRYKRLYGV